MGSGLKPTLIDDACIAVLHVNLEHNYRYVLHDRHHQGRTERGDGNGGLDGVQNIMAGQSEVLFIADSLAIGSRRAGSGK